MNDIVAGYPGKAIHVVLDDLNIHKPKNDRWLKRHSNVRLPLTADTGFLATRSRAWFSILEKKSMHGASFTSVKQLREHMNVIDTHNRRAKPFIWTEAVHLDLGKGASPSPQRPPYQRTMILGT
jgi:hypothetical protein